LPTKGGGKLTALLVHKAKNRRKLSHKSLISGNSVSSSAVRNRVKLTNWNGNKKEKPKMWRKSEKKTNNRKTILESERKDAHLVIPEKKKKERTI